jgi:hypothetical protein
LVGAVGTNDEETHRRNHIAVRYVRKGSREAIFSSDILLLTNDAWRKTSNMAFLAMKGYLVSVEHARHVLKCTCDAMMQSLAEDVKRRTSNVL